MQQPDLSSQNEPSSTPGMTLGARLGNMFVSPSEVFDEVREQPVQVANWLVPMVIVIIASIISAMVMYSQPTILQHLREPMEQKLQRQVDTGKMTQQQMDTQLATLEKVMTPTLFKVIGILAAVFLQPVMLFFMALVIWLIGTRALGGTFGYMKSVEVVGLASMVSAAGVIIMMLVAVIYGNMAITPGPVMFVSNFDPSNRLHMTLAALDVVSIWSLSVLSIGVARVAQTSFFKAALWGFGVWFVLRGGIILLFGGK